MVAETKCKILHFEAHMYLMQFGGRAAQGQQTSAGILTVYSDRINHVEQILIDGKTLLPGHGAEVVAVKTNHHRDIPKRPNKTEIIRHRPKVSVEDVVKAAAM